MLHLILYPLQKSFLAQTPTISTILSIILPRSTIRTEADNTAQFSLSNYFIALTLNIWM